MWELKPMPPPCRGTDTPNESWSSIISTIAQCPFKSAKVVSTECNKISPDKIADG